VGEASPAGAAGLLFTKKKRYGGHASYLPLHKCNGVAYEETSKEDDEKKIEST